MPDREPIYAQNEIWQMNNVDQRHKDANFMNELGGRLATPSAD